jgi:hypothetical protein
MTRNLREVVYTITLAKVGPELWDRFRDRVKQENSSIRQALVQMLTWYVERPVEPSSQQGPTAARTISSNEPG